MCECKGYSCELIIDALENAGSEGLSLKSINNLLSSAATEKHVSVKMGGENIAKSKINELRWNVAAQISDTQISSDTY